MVVGCIFPLSPSWLAPGLEKRGEIAKFGSVEQINKLLEQRGLSEPAGGWAAYERNGGPLYRQSLITENVMKNKLPFTIAAMMAENLGIPPAPNARHFCGGKKLNHPHRQAMCGAGLQAGELPSSGSMRFTSCPEFFSSLCGQLAPDRSSGSFPRPGRLPVHPGCSLRIASPHLGGS